MFGLPFSVKESLIVFQNVVEIVNLVKLVQMHESYRRLKRHDVRLDAAIANSLEILSQLDLRKAQLLIVLHRNKGRLYMVVHVEICLIILLQKNFNIDAFAKKIGVYGNIQVALSFFDHFFDFVLQFLNKYKVFPSELN